MEFVGASHPNQLLVSDDFRRGPWAGVERVAVRDDGQPVPEQRRNRRGLVVDERGVQQSLWSIDAEVVRQIDDVRGNGDDDCVRLDAYVHIAERRWMRGDGTVSY